MIEFTYGKSIESIQWTGWINKGLVDENFMNIFVNEDIVFILKQKKMLSNKWRLFYNTRICLVIKVL